MKIFYKLGSYILLATPLLTIVSCGTKTHTQNKKTPIDSKELDALKNIDKLRSSKNSQQLEALVKNISSERKITAELLGVKMPKIASNLKWIIRFKKYDQDNKLLKVLLSISRNGKTLKVKTVSVVARDYDQKENSKQNVLNVKLESLANQWHHQMIKELPLEDLLAFLKKEPLVGSLDIQSLISNLPIGFRAEFITNNTIDKNIKEMKIIFLKGNKAIKSFGFKINIDDVKKLYEASLALKNLKYLATNIDSPKKLELAFNTHKSKKMLDLSKIGISKYQIPHQGLEAGFLNNGDFNIRDPKVNIVLSNKIRSISRKIPIINMEKSDVSLDQLKAKKILKNLGLATYRRFLSKFGVEVKPGTIIHKVEALVDTKNNPEILVIKYKLGFLKNPKTIIKTKLISLNKPLNES